MELCQNIVGSGFLRHNHQVATIAIETTHLVHDVDELKQRLTKVWYGLGQSVIDDAMYEWHKRLWAYMFMSKEGILNNYYDSRAHIC